LPEPVEYHPGALECDNRAFGALSKAVEAHHGSMKAYSGALEAQFRALEAIFKTIDTHLRAILFSLEPRKEIMEHRKLSLDP
jgi:hypothetical protein